MGTAVAGLSGGAGYVPVQGFVTEEYLKDKLKEMQECSPLLCFLNLKEQLQFLDEEDTDRMQSRCFDAAIGAYLLNPLKNEYLYDGIARDFCQKNYPAREELLGKKTCIQMTEEHMEIVAKYACFQAAAALEAYRPMRERLEQEQMGRLFDEVEMPLLFALYHMEREGVLVKADELREYGIRLEGRIEQLEQEIYELAGETFNINSPKQLGVLLFEKLQMPYGKKTKTGYSTAADVLEKLAPEYPLVSMSFGIPTADKAEIHICGRAGCFYRSRRTDSQQI